MLDQYAILSLQTVGSNPCHTGESFVCQGGWDGSREWEWLSVALSMAGDPVPQPSCSLQNTWVLKLHLGCPVSLFGEASIIKREVWTKYFPKVLSVQEVEVWNISQACQLSPSRRASWLLAAPCRPSSLGPPLNGSGTFTLALLSVCTWETSSLYGWSPLLFPDAWSTRLPWALEPSF